MSWKYSTSPVRYFHNTRRVGDGTCHKARGRGANNIPREKCESILEERSALNFNIVNHSELTKMIKTMNVTGASRFSKELKRKVIGFQLSCFNRISYESIIFLYAFKEYLFCWFWSEQSSKFILRSTTVPAPPTFPPPSLTRPSTRWSLSPPFNPLCWRLQLADWTGEMTRIVMRMKNENLRLELCHYPTKWGDRWGS